MIALLLATILSAEPTAEQKAAAYARAEAAATAAERAELEKWLAGYDAALRQARLAKNGKAITWLGEQRKEKRARLEALKTGEKVVPRLDATSLKLGTAGVLSLPENASGSFEVVQVNGPSELVATCTYRTSKIVSGGPWYKPYPKEQTSAKRTSRPFIVRGIPTESLLAGSPLAIESPLVVVGDSGQAMILEPVSSPPERVQPAP